jgi:DNA-binding winged helix-turn-helix (wHTH) protein/tetratricopeptide (TPR) repeat protein
MVPGLPKSKSPVRFGGRFELDARAYELRRSGRALKLEPTPMEILLLLIERRGELVTREEIVQRIWGNGVFVDTDNSINGAIRKIRQTLDDDPGKPAFIQTVSGKGYRFLAAIEDVEDKNPDSPTLEPAENMIGRRVSHYRVLELLGGGGMGVVHKAEDLKLGRQVALKFLPSELARDAAAFERLQREARTASSLDHPNICAIYELGEQGGQPFIVMQLLEGMTLREWIGTFAREDSQLRSNKVLDFAIQITRGLQAAHEKEIIHQDIKPANIFVTASQQVKILDFGIAKFSDDAAVAIARQSDAAGIAGTRPSNVTVPNRETASQSIGTPSYQSPEQLRREKIDKRTDLFSLGLVLHEMATGQPAFSGNTVAAIREAVLTQPAAPSKLALGLPAELRRIIGRALEKELSRRYQSAEELLCDLESVQERLGAPAWWKQKWVLATACVAFVFLAAAMAAVLGRRFPFGFRRETSATAKSPTTARRSVAVLGLKNLSGRSDQDWISTAMEETLSTELASGQELRIIPDESIARLKLDLSLPAANSYSRETLDKIRTHLNADFVVLGSYFGTGKDSGEKLRVNLQLQDTRSGETVAVVSQDGTEIDLAELASRSGASLRQTLGVPPVLPADLSAVQTSIPKGPSAARFYAEGLTKLHSFDALSARDLLEKAIAADAGHALSHAALAESWSSLGYDAKAREEAKRALELSDGLSREDRLSIEGRYRELNRDFAPAVEIYKTLSNFFPDSLEYGLRLAQAQLNADHAKEASGTLSRLRDRPEPESKDARIDLMETKVCETLSDFRRMQQLAAAATLKGQLQDSRLLVAQAREREGRAWVELGDYDKAQAALSEARNLFAASKNPRDSAAAEIDLADLLYGKGDYLAAHKAYEEALRGFRATGAWQQTANALSREGSLFYDQGLLADAKRSQEEALRIDREIGSGTERDLSNLANVLEALGDLSGAVHSREEAAQGFHRQGDKNDEAMTLANLGGVLLKIGEVDSAKRHVEEAAAIQRETGHKRGLGFSMFFLAEILCAQDRLQDSQLVAEQTIALRRELKDELHIPESEMLLGEILLERGKTSEALSLVQRAAASFEQQDVPDLGAQSYADATRALLAQAKVGEANAAANHALTLSAKGGDLSASFEAKLALAAVLAQSGRSVDAAKTLSSVRDDAIRRRYVNYELEARLILGEMEIRSSKIEEGRARLQALEKDARGKGFLLIARKAIAALI